MVHQDLIQELREKHGCCGIILYGSRARGEEAPNSDIDVFCICDEGKPSTDSRIWRDWYLDAWLYPKSQIQNYQEFIHLHDGKVIFDTEDIAQNFLQQVKLTFDQGPPALPAEELHHRWTWFEKMIQRIESADLEAYYRRYWLLVDLLPFYFALSGRWYLGSKKSFQWLKTHRPKDFLLIEKAYQPNTSSAELQQLVPRILTAAITQPPQTEE